MKNQNCTVLEFSTEQVLKRLTEERVTTINDLKTARQEYLSARARKNYLTSQLENIDEQLMLIRQGQLALEDYL